MKGRRSRLEENSRPDIRGMRPDRFGRHGGIATPFRREWNGIRPMAQERLTPARASMAAVISGLRIGVLGPLQVHDGDGTPIVVGGPRPRALLVLLALQPGRTVPVERLVDGQYGGDPPAD